MKRSRRLVVAIAAEQVEAGETERAVGTAAIKVATTVGIATAANIIVVLPHHDPRSVVITVVADPRPIAVAPHAGLDIAQLGIALLLRLLAIRPLLATIGFALLGGEPLQVGIARLGVGILGRSCLEVAVLGVAILRR